MSKERIKHNLGITINKENGWISLRNDKMFRKIFSENIEFTKLLLKSTFDFSDEDLEGMTVTNGETIFSNNKKFSNFIADIIVKLKNGDKVIIEMQSYNNENSTIKNELYCDREISNQKIEENNYTKINKVYQLVIIGNNKMIKENHILLESYTKKGDRDSYHRIMDKYRKTLWLDLGCETCYAKYNKELLGLVKLFIANSEEEALESVKYNKLMKEMIKKMKEYMGSEEMREYASKELDYYDCIREDALEEGINLGREEGISLGRKEGKNQQQYEIAKNLIKSNISLDIISKCTSLPLNKINSIKSELSFASLER